MNFIIKKKCKVKLKCFINKNTILEGKNSLHDGNFSNCNIGFGTYIGKNCKGISNSNIGKFTSIGQNFKVVSNNHPINFISTYPGSFKKCKRLFDFGNRFKFDEYIKLDDGSKLNIGNDVWIGDDVTCKAGIKIGDGAIVGFGAIVTKDVEPYSIVAGNPAKIIRKRFTDEQISILLKIKWWNNEQNDIKKISRDFNNPEEFFKKIKINI